MNWFARLKVSAYEKGILKFLWTSRFLWQVGFVCAWTVITSLFIEIWGVSNLLYLFLADAWLMIIGSYAAHLLFLKVDTDRFIRYTLWGTLLSLSVAGLFHVSFPNAFFFLVALLVAKDFFYFQLHIGLLRKNESLLSPKEAQRIMPVIDTSNTVGIVVGALLFLGGLSYFSLESALWLWALPVVLLLGVMKLESRWVPIIPRLTVSPVIKKKTHGFHEAVDAVKSIKFLRFMACLIVLQAALFTIVEYEFLSSVKESVDHHKEVSEESFEASHLQASVFTDLAGEAQVRVLQASEVVEEAASKVFAHHSVAHDLGMFELIVGMIALLVQLFLASQVIERFGIVYSFLSFFGIFLALGLGFIFGGVGIKWVKGFHHSFHSIFHLAHHLSFYSVFAHKREPVRHFFEGFVYPAGMIIGVGILTITQLFWADPFAPIMVGLLCLMVLLILPMKRAFTELSHQNLTSNQDIEAKFHSIEVLSQRGHTDAVLKLGKELLNKEEHAVIREKIIITLADINDPRVIHTYLAILIDETESTALKIQILESLLTVNSLSAYWDNHAFSQHHLLEMLKNLFHTTEHNHLRKLIVMNIFVHLPTDQVVPFFLEVLSTEDAELTSVCLRSASEIFDDPEVVYYLRGYLKNKDAKVRGYALISLWKFEDHLLLSATLDQMFHSDDMVEVIAAVYAIGEIGDRRRELELLTLLDHKNDEVYLQALVALAKLENYEVIPDLVRLIFGEDVVQADKVFYMLKRAPIGIQEALRLAIGFEVSQRVMEVLLAQKASQKIGKISRDTKAYLKRLYRLAGKYDEILSLEKV